MDYQPPRSNSGTSDGPVTTAGKRKADNGTPTIRTFAREDIEQILEIEGESFPKTPYPRNLLLEYARLLPEGFIVIEVGGDIAGYLIFDSRGHVYSTAVKPAYRRHGLGRRLFGYASEHAHDPLWLEVRSRNSTALHFYERLGMKVVRRIAKYYGKDDALVMAQDQEP